MRGYFISYITISSCLMLVEGARGRQSDQRNLAVAKKTAKKIHLASEKPTHNVTALGQAAGESDEHRLMNDMLENYETSIRPVLNTSTPIFVLLGITLTQIFDLDEKNQVLTTIGWLNYVWHDELLTWNVEDYNGLKVLIVPSERVWLPDIVLYNNADDFTKGYMKNRAVVFNDGKVFWAVPAKMRSSCKVDVQYFPFDTQECHFVLGSWSYDRHQIELFNSSTDAIDLHHYTKSGEWELQSVSMERSFSYYDYESCCPAPFSHLTFKLVMRRKVLYYAYNIILPCIMMSVLTLLVFVLPPDSGEKIALGITVLLAFSVFMLAVAEKLPETSDSMPLISIYLTAIMVMASISVIMTVVVIDIDWRQPNQQRVPEWVKKIFLGKVASWVRIETDYNPGSKSTDKRAGRALIFLTLPLHAKPGVHDVGCARNEWRQVAQVMDRCLFWIFCLALTSATFILLVILPAYYNRNTGPAVETTL